MNQTKPEMIAVIGDLYESRKIQKRQLFGQSLKMALIKINKEYATHIFAPLLTVRGIDEISGVLNRPDFSFEICARVNEEIYPAKIRWGIGTGSIDVNKQTKDAGAIDGPAFHNAAAAMKRARKEGLVYAFYMPQTADVSVALIESSAQLYSEIIMTWTEKSAEVARAMRKTQTQSAAAEMLNLSPQRISQIMKRGSLKVLTDFEHTMSWYLSETL